EPEVSIVEEEIDSVLLGLNGVVERTRSDDLEVSDRDFVATRRARIGAHRAGDAHRRLLRECREALPHFGRECGLREYCLRNPGPVADDAEGDLPRRPEMRDPAVNGHRRADVVAQIGDARYQVVHGVRWDGGRDGRTSQRAGAGEGSMVTDLRRLLPGGWGARIGARPPRLTFAIRYMSQTANLT